MRYAFRAAVFFTLCLMLAQVTPFPAYALEGDDAASSSGRAGKKSSEATADHSAAAPETGRRSGTEQDAEAGWVKVESGSRQAYVGIHGGTAPLSLMRSTDGVLFAFTGQTGNDFTQVLRGGNASRAAPRHPARNGTKQMRAMDPAEETAVAGNALSRPADAENTSPPSKTATPVRSGEAARPLAEKHGEAPKPADALRPTPPNKEQPPASSAKLVFASGEMASRDASRDYQPFGLTPPANPLPETMSKAVGSAPATPVPPLGKPLKLRSYQQLLNYSGSV